MLRITLTNSLEVGMFLWYREFSHSAILWCRQLLRNVLDEVKTTPNQYSSRGSDNPHIGVLEL